MAKKAQGRGAGRASASRRRGGQRANRGGGSDEISNYKQKRRAEKQLQASKKGSCAPKLFMLILPFAAAGTYLFLRS